MKNLIDERKRMIETIDIPIDFLSDHLDSFKISVTYASGKGYKSEIHFNVKNENVLVYTSPELFNNPYLAFNDSCLYLDKNAQSLVCL